jgi:hypothetical protein
MEVEAVLANAAIGAATLPWIAAASDGSLDSEKFTSATDRTARAFSRSGLKMESPKPITGFPLILVRENPKCLETAHPRQHAAR